MKSRLVYGSLVTPAEPMMCNPNKQGRSGCQHVQEAASHQEVAPRL